MGASGGGSEAANARLEEQARQTEIRFGRELINTIFDGTEENPRFGDEFFGKRRQSYIDFARPQLDQQHSEAKKQLIFTLARAGLVDSSVAGEQNAELARQYGIGLQNVTDKARESETNARNSIESARSDLMTTLQATGDATGAANSAIARAGALSREPAYSPVAQLFTDFTDGLSTQAALERAEAATGRDYARYRTGLFGTPTTAVKYT